MKTIRYLSACLLLLLPICGHTAWSNYFRIVNNFDFPITASIQPQLSTVSSTCGDLHRIDISAKSLSCELEFKTDQEHWYSPLGNNGTITVAKTNDPNSYCTYQYNYTFSLIPYSYFDIHSEIISNPTCHGDLSANEISVVNDHNKALPRPLSGNVLIDLDKTKASESTESLSQTDCGGQGGDNCIVLSPDLTKQYLSNGSTLGEALVLQNQLDRFEPLNFKQMLGTHNSAISQHYTSSTSTLNLSYGDPDNYLSLTDQLNSGLRLLELDIQWYNNTVTICHNHVSTNLQGILCDGDFPIRSALTEIHTWIQNNPNALLFIYLDVNLPLKDHVTDLDNELSVLEPYIYTPAMASDNFHVANNTLPAVQLSQNDVIHRFHKNIIITNDDDVDNVKSSRYVFVYTQNSKDSPLPENSIDTILAQPNFNCNQNTKYTSIRNLYSNDSEHYNLYRVNGDRTVINYVNSSGDKAASEFSDYISTFTLASLLKCPLNIFSTNMLGFTCGTNNCDTHPTDPRLYTYLWSWGLGYPLNNGSDIAYINPSSTHFENSPFTTNNTYTVLCIKPTSQNTPSAALNWYVASLKISDPKSIADSAKQACADSGGRFAVPTTSYWLDDVLHSVTNNTNIIVNYQRINNTWIPNDGLPITH